MTGYVWRTPLPFRPRWGLHARKPLVVDDQLRPRPTVVGEIPATQVSELHAATGSWAWSHLMQSEDGRAYQVTSMIEDMREAIGGDDDTAVRFIPFEPAESWQDMCVRYAASLPERQWEQHEWERVTGVKLHHYEGSGDFGVFTEVIGGPVFVFDTGMVDLSATATAYGVPSRWQRICSWLRRLP